MYIPAPFVETDINVLDEVVSSNPFAILVSNGPDHPYATHLPTYLERRSDSSAVLRCHLARANPHWRLLESTGSVLAIFQGPHHYVSPSWYPSKRVNGRVVPTWNYIVVHATGTPRLFEGKELIEHVADLTRRNESGFEHPWSVDDAPRDYIEGLAKAIVGVEISVQRMEGKWKLNQNRPEADRAGVVEGLEALGTDAGHQMADLMRTRLNHSK
jgi:transcriptional regulator